MAYRQSAYRTHHSAETALVRIHNDIAQSIDSRRSVLLVLLDLNLTPVTTIYCCDGCLDTGYLGASSPG